MTYLYTGVAVVGRHDPVLGEHEVDGPAGLPPLHVDGDGGVGLGVPLRDLLEPVQHVACAQPSQNTFFRKSLTVIFLLSFRNFLLSIELTAFNNNGNN